jgi:hypothetical protein
MNTMLNDLLWSDPGKFKGWYENLEEVLLFALVKI